MMFRRKSPVEAFQFGVDTAPDWFKKAVKNGEVLIYNEGPFKSRKCILINAKNEFSTCATQGDFIMNQGKTMEAYKPDYFLKNFEKVEEV